MREFRPVPKGKKQPKNVPSKTRKYVYKRDNHSCVRCGATKSIQLHHLITRGRYNDLSTILNSVHDHRNLVCVCFVCHRKIHDHAEIMAEMLQYQQKMFGDVFKYD